MKGAEEAGAERRVVHVDMDAFYASVEQLDHPEYLGKPVIVGASDRGVVCAASYEARKFGVHSAMPVFQARKCCPGGIFLPVRMKRYRELSRTVMEVLRTFSPLVEQVSVDEAYLDLTGMERILGDPPTAGRRLKDEVKGRTGLTCSVGIAPNKYLAKIASDLRKPDGLVVVEKEEVPRFLASIPLKKLPGIGARTLPQFKELGIEFIADVLRFPEAFWVKRFGKQGADLFERAGGIDDSPVTPFTERKSCSAEDTFTRDTNDPDVLLKWMQVQAESVGRELREKGLKGKTVTLKLKTSDFVQMTRSHTLRESTDCTGTIFDTAAQLLRGVDLSRKFRLVGVGVSNLVSGPSQMRLARDRAEEKQEQLDRAMDRIAEKFGDTVVKRGRVFDFD